MLLRYTETRYETRGSDTIQTSSLTSHVHLVDLAGSERVKVSKVQGQELVEARNINLSLSTLGRVIDVLAEGCAPSGSGSRIEPPYRDSTLTWLLRNSFGGNSRTVMLATVSPAPGDYEETMNTLRYASRARRIVLRATVNVDTGVKQMVELQREIEGLQAQLETLPERLAEKNAQVTVLLHSWRWVAMDCGNTCGGL